MKRARGFTLLELVVALAILGLAYALVPPLFAGARDGVELKSAARQVAAGLRQARNYAVTRQTEAVLTLDVDRRGFKVTGDSRTYPLPDRVQLKLLTAQREVGSDQVASIRFFADGSSNGGRVTLSAGDRRFDVDVDWLTGRVVILN